MRRAGFGVALMSIALFIQLEPADRELLQHDDRAVRELLGRPRWVQVVLRRAAWHRLRLRRKEQTVVLRVVGDVSEPVAPDLWIRRSTGRQHFGGSVSGCDRLHANARQQHDGPAVLDDTNIDRSELIGGVGCRGTVAVHHRPLPRAPTCELRDHPVHGVLRDEWNAEVDLRLRERLDHDDGHDRDHRARAALGPIAGRDELLGHLASQLMEKNVRGGRRRRPPLRFRDTW